MEYSIVEYRIVEKNVELKPKVSYNSVILGGEWWSMYSKSTIVDLLGFPQTQYPRVNILSWL